MNHNQSLISQKQQKILLSNGRIADQTDILELKQKELNILFPEIRKEIDLLKVRMGNVNSVSTVSFEQHKSIIAQLRDSISVVPHKENGTMQDTLQYNIFSYHDEFYNVSGFAHKEQQFLSISSRDTMTQVVYQKRKNPLLWIFSPKVYEQRVYFKNPNANIHYSRTINIHR